MSEKQIAGWVKPTLEMGPVIGFFIAYLWLKDKTFTIGGVEYAGFIAPNGKVHKPNQEVTFAPTR